MSSSPFTSALLGAALLALAGVPTVSAAKGDDYVGLGLSRAPVYDGARVSEWRAVPILNFEREHVAVGTARGYPEVSVFSMPIEGVRLGLALSLDGGRKRSESDVIAVRQLGDLDPVAWIGPFAEVSLPIGPLPVQLSASWRRALDSDRGARASVELSAGIYEAKSVRLETFGQLDWGDSRSMTSEFGVSAGQSASSGLPEYRIDSGARYRTIGLRGTWDLNSQWFLIGSLEYRRASSTVKSSPQVSSASGNGVTLGVAYRFR